MTIGRFNDTMDGLYEAMGMGGEPMYGDFPTEDDLPAPEDVSAESLNPLWGPNGESLGSTYGVDEGIDTEEQRFGLMDSPLPDDEMGVFPPGDMAPDVGMMDQMGPDSGPEISPEDLRDTYLYQMQSERDTSREFQESNVEQNKETRKKARKLRGV